jgi:hypothetical protein
LNRIIGTRSGSRGTPGGRVDVFVRRPVDAVAAAIIVVTAVGIVVPIVPATAIIDSAIIDSAIIDSAIIDSAVTTRGI